MKQLKRILSALLAVLMVMSTAVLIGAANISFTDVSGHWAWTGGQIPYLVEKNVLNGYQQSNGTYLFKPDGEVTRAEFIKMLDETFGLTATAAISYSDIASTDWYAPYFQKATAQGYILNYGDKGEPNSKITRQEATALLVRYLNLPTNEKAAENTFADYNEIADNYKEYVLCAIYANIINGYSENGKSYFKPMKTLSRAEALTILYRAAGCIFNQNAYSRDGGAPASNNVITRGDIAVSRVTFGGRNIVSEGASTGTVTLTDCTVNGTLYVRGGANLLLAGTKADEIVMMGGGKISMIDGSKVGNLVLNTPGDVNIYSGTVVDNLEVNSGAKNVSVIGDGSITKANINASGFRSAMTPGEFTIGNNLTAVFASSSYSGSSDGQEVFEITPFVTADNEFYYLNVLPTVKGKLYYYYTNDAVRPTTSGYDPVYALSSFANYKELTSAEPVAIKTYAKDQVSRYQYVVLQLQAENMTYVPVVIDNKCADGNGFTTAPFLYDEETAKFKTETSGTLYWFYADSGKSLSCAEFLGEYNKSDAKLRSEVMVTSIQTYLCQLDTKITADYEFVAFMLRGSDGLYHEPVVISVGDNGFEKEPVVTTPGTISFTTDVNGDLYYYYSATPDLPTSDQFSTAYTKARDGDHMSVSRGDADTLKYNTKYLDDYSYLILSIRDKNKDYMLPVCVNIDYTTGFDSEPEIRDVGEIRFKTTEAGTVLYYYTKTPDAPSNAEFMEEYESASAKHKGSKETGNINVYIDYSQVTASSYPYMVFLFTDGKKQYSPVVLELDFISQTGFVTAPTVKNGMVSLNVDGDGEIFYFYDRSEFNCAASDFYEYWEDATYSGKLDASKTTLELDSDALKKNTCLYLAYLPAKYADRSDFEDYFSYPYVLDIESAERAEAGSGIDDYWVHKDESGKVDVIPEYSGYLYYYTTSSKDELPSYGNFYSKYRKAEDADYMRVTKQEEITLKAYDAKYLVICMEVEEEFMAPVIIDINSRTIYDEGFEDGSTTDEYGLSSVKLLSNYTVSLIAKYSGYVTLYSYDGKDMRELNSIEVKADEQEFVAFPAFMQSSALFDLMLGGSDIYVQLVSNGTIYRAYKVN